jgi:pseudouridine-5'-phosphate glycosidase
VRVHDEVRDALAAGRPVVALESTIISHGLPRPDNARLAREFEQAVRDGGAVPATIAVIDGQAHIGLDDDALDRLANDDATVKSADLTTLSHTGVLVVCAGVKSILDVGATLERLETLGVGVLGYRTDRFPGFYLADSGHDIGWRVESPDEVAAILAARDRVGTTDLGLVLANPISAADELDRDVHDRLLKSGLAAADRDGVQGKDVTPYLLDFFHRESGGASLRANVALVRSNARLAAEVATVYAAGTPS